MGDKLYVIVCRNYEPGIQACMGIHALQEFAIQYPEINQDWYTNSNYLGFLSVADENELSAIISKAEMRNIHFSVYRESDFDNKIVAIALEPSNKSKKLCSSLPLALKPLKNELADT